MRQHGIKQQIHFCYGHRLRDYEGKCKHPHGHNALAELTFDSDKLDHRGMVIDFGDIKQALKTWIDQKLDHQMLLRKDDPLLNILKEMNEPCFVMEENPTAENIAKVIFERAKAENLPIVEVTLWETPSQCASYRR